MHKLIAKARVFDNGQIGYGFGIQAVSKANDGRTVVTLALTDPAYRFDHTEQALTIAVTMIDQPVAHTADFTQYNESESRQELAVVWNDPNIDSGFWIHVWGPDLSIS